MTLRFRPMVAYYGLRCGSDRGTSPRIEAERYARHNNGHISSDGHYREFGRPHRRTRPALVKALRRAEDTAALLVIPEFEPLASDAVFLRLLWESGVEFVACDNEHANRTTLPLLASLVIKRSQQAKRVWTKRRRKGMPENLTPEARRRGGQAMRHHLAIVAERLHEPLLALRAEGKSLRQIAATLYDQGERSETGRPWSHTRVRRLIAYCEEEERQRAARRAEWEAKKAVPR